MKEKRTDLAAGRLGISPPLPGAPARRPRAKTLYGVERLGIASVSEDEAAPAVPGEEKAPASSQIPAQGPASAEAQPPVAAEPAAAIEPTPAIVSPAGAPRDPQRSVAPESPAAARATDAAPAPVVIPPPVEAGKIAPLRRIPQAPAGAAPRPRYTSRYEPPVRQSLPAPPESAGPALDDDGIRFRGRFLAMGGCGIALLVVVAALMLWRGAGKGSTPQTASASIAPAQPVAKAVVPLAGEANQKALTNEGSAVQVAGAGQSAGSRPLARNGTTPQAGGAGASPPAATSQPQTSRELAPSAIQAAGPRPQLAKEFSQLLAELARSASSELKARREESQTKPSPAGALPGPANPIAVGVTGQPSPPLAGAEAPPASPAPAASPAPGPKNIGYKVAPEGIVVSAIMHGTDGPIAVINNQFMKVGQTVGQAKVLRINEFAVEMEEDGQRFLVSLSSGARAATEREEPAAEEPEATPAPTATPAPAPAPPAPGKASATRPAGRSSKAKAPPQEPKP
jgi:hypothetical protein